MAAPAAAERTGAAVFARVLAGVDGSDAGLEAARQAARLVAPGGTLELARAIYLIDANLQDWPQERVAATLEREGGPALRAAASRAGRRAETRLLNGPPKQALLEEAARLRATLIVVGTHEHTRLSELLIGGVAGPLLREAACSVLIARPARSEERFPLSVAVGIDGPPGPPAASTVGEYLGARFGASVRAVDGGSVAVLVDASRSADLVVVGCRDLRGLRAVGSVSERVAHHAHCSVLVVRTPPTREDVRTSERERS